MIPKNASNRRVIIDYLENCSEDDLIDQVIIPIMNTNGYSLVRKVSHGPGEHGKDIIFSRFSPSFLDLEYLVVQAKAIAVTAGNVVDYSNQLIRALRTPVTGINGTSQLFPNYVVFFNSKRITNDANFEFPYLIDGKNNIKLLHQDNVYELMTNNSIIPDSIKQQIFTQDGTVSDQDKRVTDILSNNKPSEVEALFNYILPTFPNLSASTQAIIIEYIFYTWNEDKSWDGTVKPMRWLSKYFSFIQPEQYKKINEVIAEYFSGTPSYAARTDTIDIFKKITPEMIEGFKSEFILDVATIIFNDKDDRIAFNLANQIDGNAGTTGRAQSLWPLIQDYINYYFSTTLSPDERKIKLKESRKALRKVYWGDNEE